MNLRKHHVFRGVGATLCAIGSFALLGSGCGEDKPTGTVVSASKRGASSAATKGDSEPKKDVCETLLEKVCADVDDCAPFKKTFRKGLEEAGEAGKSQCEMALDNKQMLDAMKKAAAATAAASAKAEPAEPAKAEPAKAEPAKAEPAKAEPAKTEPAKAGTLTGPCAEVVAAVCKEEPKCDAWKAVFSKGMASVGDTAALSCKAMLDNKTALGAQVTAAKGLARAGAVVTTKAPAAAAAGAADSADPAKPAPADPAKPAADTQPAVAASAVGAMPTPTPAALPPLPTVTATPITAPAPAPPKLAAVKVKDSKLSKGEFKCGWGGCKAKGGITAAHVKLADEKMKWDKNSIEFQGKAVTNADIASIVALKDKVKHLRLVSLEGVTDISPLGHLTNLESLEVSRSKGIKDYSALLHLTKLKKLRITDLASGNLDFMANLKALEEAKLSSIWGDDHLTDIKGLAGATNLTKLELRAKEVTDIGALANLTKLGELYLWVKATDLKPLLGSKDMKKLDLYAVPTEDLSPVAQLAKLESLYVYMTKSATNPLLGHLKALKRLDATMAKFDDITFVKHLTQLEEVDLWNVKLKKWDGLEYLTNLKELDVSDTNIPNLGYVVGMTGLKELDLSGLKDVKDLKSLANLKALETLDLEGCSGLTSIATLTALPALKKVTLSKTTIADLTPLKGAAALETLSLVNTKNVDLKPMEGHATLASVSINGAEGIKNLEVLKTLPKLRSLTYTEGQVPEAMVKALKDKKVWLSARKAPQKK